MLTCLQKKAFCYNICSLDVVQYLHELRDLVAVCVKYDPNNKSQVWIFMQMRCLASYWKLKLLTTKENEEKGKFNMFWEMHEMPD